MMKDEEQIFNYLDLQHFSLKLGMHCSSQHSDFQRIYESFSAHPVTHVTFRSISESSLYCVSEATTTEARTGTIILDSFFLDTR